MISGSVPSTKIGSQPIPSKYFVKSASDLRDKIVGFEILKPFISRIGNTAPSLTGLMKTFENQLVANGPVSDSPSPITVAAMTSGLSRIAPAA